MAGDFEFLRNKFPDLAENGAKAESYLYSDNKACMSYISTIFDSALKRICKFNGIDISTEDKYAEWIVELRNRGIIDYNMNNTLHDLRLARNAHSHNEDNSFTASHRKTLLSQCLTVCTWLNNKYGSTQQRKTTIKISTPIVTSTPQKTTIKKPSHYHIATTEAEHKFLDSCDFSNIEDIKNALDSGVDINVRESDGLYKGMTALMQAARHANSGVVKFLLETGADIDAQDDEGWTAFMWAIAPDEYLGSKIAVIEMLAKAGANVNAKNKEGETALHIAITLTHPPELVYAFVKAGCDVNIRDNIGLTALDILENGDVFTYENSVEKSQVREALRGINPSSDNAVTFLSACMNGTVEEIKNALDSGVNVNVINRLNFYDQTGLMLAVANGRVENVKFLIKAGADINARDDDNRTILMRVFSSSSFYNYTCLLQIIEALVKAGCDVNATDYAGKTVFDYVTEADITQDEKNEIINILNRHEEYAKVKREREIKERQRDELTFNDFDKWCAWFIIGFPFILAMILEAIFLIGK